MQKIITEKKKYKQENIPQVLVVIRFLPPLLQPETPPVLSVYSSCLSASTTQTRCKK